jgi:hypothetical protein
MPMNHSNNESAGQIWGDYWSDTDQNSSCYYCHGDTRHNATGLGTVAQITGTVNNSISNSSSAWCRGCHQNDSSIFYFGESFNPAPPDIANQTGSEESTRPSYYYNHSLSNYNDSVCDDCHSPTPTPANISDLMHNVKIGSAGSLNCTSCHDLNNANAPKHVNFSAMNRTDAIHAQLNNRTGDNGTAISSAVSDQNNRKCWACHSNGPWTCYDCHADESSMIYNTLNWSARDIPKVVEHYSNTSADINAIASAGDNYNASCIGCHQNSSIWEMLLPNESVGDYDVGSFDPYGTGAGGNAQT